MKRISCPQCNQTLNIEKEGVYKCPDCQSTFEYTKKKVNLLEKGNGKTLSTQVVTYSLWVLSLLGILFSFVVLATSLFGGFLVLLSAILIMPPIRNLYSQRLKVRYLHALIISFIFFIVGLGYMMNVYVNSDEYKQSVAQQESDKKLESERQKRLEAERIANEEKKEREKAEELAKKEKEEREKLERLIAEAQAINEDYPEEKDGVKTDVKGTQDANIRLINETETISDKETNEEKTLTKLLDVIEVVDGDTIKVSELGTLRLIGIDTPETVDPRKPVQCFGKEASDKAKSLLSGKKVRLEFDTSQGRLDKYGRTLAYVYREDGLFFNKEMIKQGFAHEYTYSTPYKYQSEFKKAQSEAQEAKSGLWGSACKCEKGEEVSKSCTACNQLTVKKYNWDCSTYTEKVSSSSCSYKCSTTTPVAPKPSSPYTCNCSKTCSQITSCAEAQYQLKTCGCSARDGDDDGIACDSMCQ
ncbi:MAG TPA: thermonuclease family protein [Candidatus Dojkabacteria bacterium]|nr:thermonuclease family protein [Candidatus Dojkabacteria bacterium]